MRTLRTPLVSMLAWLPLVAALALAVGWTPAVAIVLLLGLGGLAASPLAELTTVPVAARVRRVCRVRAPDALERRRAR